MNLKKFEERKISILKKINNNKKMSKFNKRFLMILRLLIKDFNIVQFRLKIKTKIFQI